MVPYGTKPDHPLAKPAAIAAGIAVLTLVLAPVWVAVPLGLLAGYGWLRMSKDMSYSENNTLGLILIAILGILVLVAVPAKKDYELRKAFRGLGERMAETKQQIPRSCADGKLVPATVDLLKPPAAAVPNVLRAVLAVDQSGAWKITIILADVFIDPLGVWEYAAVSRGSELTFTGTCAARKSTWRFDGAKGVERPQVFLPPELHG